MFFYFPHLQTDFYFFFFKELLFCIHKKKIPKKKSSSWDLSQKKVLARNNLIFLLFFLIIFSSQLNPFQFPSWKCFGGGDSIRKLYGKKGIFIFFYFFFIHLISNPKGLEQTKATWQLILKEKKKKNKIQFKSCACCSTKKN